MREKFATFAGEKCSVQNSGGNVEDPRVHILRNQNFPQHGTGLSLDPEYLVTGSNSGWQAINLAVLAGAREVILLGYDGAPGADGRTHFFGNHPRVEPLSVYPIIRRSFAEGAAALRKAGVRVINASPGTAIDAFPKQGLTETLASLDKMA